MPSPSCMPSSLLSNVFAPPPHTRTQRRHFLISIYLESVCPSLRPKRSSCIPSWRFLAPPIVGRLAVEHPLLNHGVYVSINLLSRSLLTIEKGPPCPRFSMELGELGKKRLCSAGRLIIERWMMVLSLTTPRISFPGYDGKQVFQRVPFHWIKNRRDG